LLTGSRSSLIGLLLLTLILIGKSQKLWTYLFFACMVAPFAFFALPDSLKNRFETIINPEVGPANAQESADGRWLGLSNGVMLWSTYPLSGCGPGVWRPATGSTIEAHQLYGQIIGEMGTIGVITFASIIFCFYINIRQMRKWQKQLNAPPEAFLFRLTRAIGISVFLMLVMGNFGHNLFRYNWLWFGGFLIIAHHCVRLQIRQQMRVAAPVWSMPMMPRTIA